MRKFLCFITVFLFLFNSSGQNLIARHDAIDVTGNMISINSKNFYIETYHKNGLCCNLSSMIVGIDKNGQVLFRKFLTNFLIKIIRTHDDCILAIGYDRYSCDVGGHKDALIKIDTNGVTQFQNMVHSNFVGSFWGDFTDVTQHTDSCYYIASSTYSSSPSYKQILKYSKTGIFVSKIDSLFKTINSVTSLNNGNLLLNGIFNDTLSNVEISTTGTVVHYQHTTNNITKFIKSSSGLFIGRDKNGNLASFTANLIAVTNYTTNSIRDLTERNDSVFVTGSIQPNKNPFYGILGPGFSHLYFMPSVSKSVTPTSITISDLNEVSIISHATSSIVGASFSELYKLPLTGNLNRKHDIGVSDFKLIDSTLSHGSSSPIISYKINATIKNYGSTTVNSFYLNHSFDCYSLFHKLYTISIPPGGTITVETGQFTGGFAYPDPITNTPGTPYKDEACLFTTVPDSTGDLDISNDILCKTYTLGFVGMKESDELSSSLSLYPNPVFNQVTVASETPINRMLITNIMGQVVGKDEEIQQNTFHKDLNYLSTGIYFIRLETEKGTLVKKIIKN